VARLILDPNEVFMLVHSGSRSLGESILGAYMDIAGGWTKGSELGTFELKTYLEGHDLALNFAKRNRFLIAHRILEQIASRKTKPESLFAINESDCLIDIYHNFVEPIKIAT
jgi:release factor H-coupled RctB family protein